MTGGIDKRVLAQGQEEIDQEFEDHRIVFLNDLELCSIDFFAGGFEDGKAFLEWENVGMKFFFCIYHRYHLS